MWHNVWAVIRREYLQRVRSKAFVFGTIAAPAMLIVMVGVPILLQTRGQQDERRIALVDETGELTESLVAELDDLAWTTEVVPWADEVEDELRGRVVARDLSGFVIVDAETLTTGRATFVASEQPSTLRRITLQTAINRSALRHLVERTDAQSTAIVNGGALRVEVLGSDGGPSGNEADFIVAFMGGFLLYMVILIYAVAVMRATLEEKTSRIVEVIVSSMKPWHLLLGKILGVGAVSLTQLAVWLLSGALAASAGIPMVLAARPDITGLINIQAALPGLGLLALFACFFVFGFFMFSGLYAMVGAMCSTESQTQQVQFPIILFLVVPLMTVSYVVRDPGSTASVALSLFPLFSPIVMWARVAVGGVPAWQVGLSFALMGAAVLAIAWTAGRIYRVGILMSGKRATLPELWRWVREA